MAENIEQKLDGKIKDKDAYVHAAYESAIGYYRNASRSNKPNGMSQLIPFY